MNRKPGPTNAVLVACEICTTNVWRFRAELNRRSHCYCSKECAGIARRNRDPSKFFSATKLIESGCLIWIRHVNEHGYGTTCWNGERNLLAHRVAYLIRHGSIPDGLNILHRCDTPACVNADHLFAGTQADNVRDMFAKGRGRPAGRIPNDSNARASA